MCCPGLPGIQIKGGAFKYLVSWICHRSFYLISNCSLSMFRGAASPAGFGWSTGTSSVCQPCPGTACTSQDTFSVGVFGVLGSSTRTRGIHQTHRGKQQPILTSPKQQQHKASKEKHPHSTPILQALSGFTKFCLNCPGYLFSLL